MHNWLPTTEGVAVPCCTPHNVGVKMGLPPSGSVMVVQMMMLESSTVVCGGTMVITGRSLTGVITSGTRMVSHLDGVPLSQTMTQAVSTPLKFKFGA
jgi:hypothetical protein